MKGKIVLITGSSDGIGKQTALDLAWLDAHLIIHGRNPQRSEQALNDIRQKSGNNNIDSVSGDLSSLEEIRNISDEIHEKYDHLDVLINNAGVFKHNRELSRDGFEMTFAVNHLSYFLMSNLLLDLLQKSQQGRIINVASMAHSSSLDFENLQGEKYYEGYDAYARSKLCNILFTYELANQLMDSNITVNCLHPGVISTKLLHDGFGTGGSPLTEGSKTSVYLASSPEVEHISGKYYANRRQAKSAEISYNRSLQNQLWEISKKMVGL